MCSQNQNFLQFISVFHKKTHFTQKWNFFIRVDTLFSCASLSTVSNYSTPKHKRTRHFSPCTRFVFFFYFDPSSQVFYFPYRLFSGGFYSPRACSRLFSDVSLPVDAPSNLWDPPGPCHSHLFFLPGR